MVYPATHFVRFLLVSLDDQELPAINTYLQRVGLASITKHQLAEIVEGIPREPDNFQPWNRAHRPSVNWLRKTKIYSLVHRDPPVAEAFELILGNPKTREDVERMLIGGVSPMEVSYQLQGLKRKVSTTAIAEFAHYFWNCTAMGVADWADYFRTANTKSRLNSLQKDYTAALLAGPELALYRTGIKTKINTKTMMEDLMRELWFTFEEVKTLPLSAKKVDMLSNITRGIVRVDERLQASDAVLADVLKQFEKFQVAHDDALIPSLQDLAPAGTVSNKGKSGLQIGREG